MPRDLRAGDICRATPNMPTKPLAVADAHGLADSIPREKTVD